MNFTRIIVLLGFCCVNARAVSAATYFLDTGTTNGNVYTTAVGNDTNSGTSASTPKRTLTNLLASVNLVAGDIVYIDTGIYSNYTITVTNSGALGNPIIFQGSTNVVAGGSVITRDNSGLDVFALRANHLEFRNLTVANGIRGFNGALQFPPPTGVVLDQVTVRGNVTGLQRGQWIVRRSIFQNNAILRDPNSSSYDFDSCSFIGNGADAGAGAEANITMNNCVYVGGDFLANVLGDYNVFWDVRLLNQSRAYLYEYGLTNSTFADPGFANATSSNFYPQSVTGRFNPATGAVVTDSVHSVLIDFGNPASTAWTNESVPNGARQNAGAYSGIGEASRSRTNAWLFALTFNDGGAITGSTHLLVWNSGSFTSGATLRIDYSPNDGISWSNITTGVSATNRSFAWNVTGLAPMAALWRVISESNTNVWSQNRQRFSVGGVRVPYYLNDQSTNGAYYTQAIGNDTNNATRTSAPKLSLTNLLASSFVLGKHDIIYVDTGIYSNYTIDVRRYGVTNQPLIIQGVPKPEATVFRRNANASIFQFFASHCLLRDLTLEGGGSNGALYDGGGSAEVNVETCILRNNVVGFRRGTVTVRNSIMFSNTTLIVSDAGAYSFDQCVFWRNGQIQGTSRPWSVSNSVFVGGIVNGLSFLTGGDYCTFWDLTFDGYLSLHDIQDGLNKFLYSSYLNPNFFDPANFKFQPKSKTGRYDPVTDTFAIDTEHSPVIDFGNPSSFLWTNEPSPNGNRLNLGANGGTPYASKSLTNAWLQVLSYNDGGQISIPTDVVTWNSGNLASGATVRVEFSFNGGSSWVYIGTNLLASSGSYLVTDTNYASSRFARWRVVLESSPSILSSNLVNFTYRNGPYKYYVNDSATAGDVYCSAPGNTLNLGTTPDQPKESITSVLTNYTLEAGDVMYVDTGVYSSSVTINVPALASGTNGNPVIIQGSTNLVFGSVIVGPAIGGNAPGFTFASGANNIRLRDLIIQRRTTGISLSNNNNIDLDRIRIESNSVSGISASGVAGLRLRNVAIRGNAQDGLSVGGAGDVSVAQSVIWMNGLSAIRTTGTRVTVTNSVLGIRGSWRSIYIAPTFTNIIANYNVLRVEQNASAAKIDALDRSLDTLAAWQVETGMDLKSLDVDPRFVNGDAGDFHLQSQAIQGRFDPILGWITDTVTSPLIDAGDPSASFVNETAPNGGRANIGYYGNTPEASRSDLPRVFAGNLNQGGFVKGTTTLHWVTGGLMSNSMVYVDVSLDGGESWTPLTTGLLASAEQIIWNTTTNAAVVAGLWRMGVVGDPSLTSQTTNFFGIRNTPLTYYVNDNSTVGSLFTTGSGSATNWVATSNRPLNSLSQVFDRYDVNPGDRIYVDRGIYSASTPIRIESRHSGSTTSGVVTIVGATTCAGGATPASEFVGSGLTSQTGLILDQARHVVISNILVRQVGTGLSVNQGVNLQFDGLRILQTSSNGAVINLSTNVDFRRSLVSGCSGYGWVSQTNVQTRLNNSLFISNKFGSIYVTGGSLGVTNSVFIVNEPGLAIFTVANNGLIRSDYNNLKVDKLSNIARINTRLFKYPASWQEATTNDLRSLSHDPGFYNSQAGDYHLLSSAGRYDSGGCFVVTDEVNSVMIDAGNQLFSVGSEPVPNGGRVNIGVYGGGTEASQSSTNGRLLTLSLNSGGTVRGTNTLYWYANQAVTSHLVYIDVSFNNGVTWTNIATNINAAVSSFVWDASQLESSALGRWRISSQNDGSLVATSEVAFTLNNGSIKYYVNDASTNGDLYASAPGLSGNDGLSAQTPVSSVEAIFGQYLPGPGDIVYIDTGNYEFLSTVTLDANNSGLATNPVIIQGSTNWVMGGSRFNMNRQGPLFQINSAGNLLFSDLTLTNARYCFAAQLSTNLQFNQVTLSAAPNFSEGGGIVAYGFRLESSFETIMDRVIIKGVTNRSDSAGILIRQFGQSPLGHLSIRNCILWSNNFGIWAQSALPVSMSNSVIHVSGENGIAMRFPDASLFNGDFNNYRVESGARLAELKVVVATNFPPLSMPIYFTTMQAWRNYSGRDNNSLTYESGFANPAELDFGLLSTAGRWTPSGLVSDMVSSVLIDAGNPVWSFSNEPAPNGSRVNVGPAADSSRASLTPTSRTVVLRSLHDGGFVQGTNVLLRWSLRGDFTGKTFTVQLSTNSGQTFVTVSTNVSASLHQYSLDSTLWTSGHGRMWRLTCEQEPGVTAQSEKAFAIRNTNFVFYVNDSSVTGDVYTTAIGSSGKTGVLPSEPKNNVQEVLSAYTLVGGDIIYVDTGVYESQGNITVTPRDEYSFPGVISFIGSTNISAGGTVLQNGGFVLRDTRFNSLKNFSVQGSASAGISVNSSASIDAEGFHIAGAGHGLYLQNAVDVTFRRTSVIGAKTNGILLFLENRNIAFDHGVIWTNQGFAVNPVNSISISNSVLAASGTDKFIYSGSSNQSYNLNYNVYFITNGARLARLTFNQEPFPREFATLAAWRNIFIADGGTMAGDPQFADPSKSDFHPRSSGGRWSDAITNFIPDVLTSMLVDSGDPAATFTNELSPNGLRMNIGKYGNSSFASKSPVDADYLLVRLNDGGSVSGTNVILSWVARGLATGHTAKVEVSLDGGSSWIVLASNVPPTTTSISWNTTGLVSTVVGSWRVSSELQPTINATAGQFFAVRNGPILFYVNDNSRTGDVFATTNGSPLARGISPGTPISSLSALLDLYDIEPGDVVYMDTGTYSNNSPILIDQLDAGFLLFGSTNSPVGGTKLLFSNSSIGIHIRQAPNTSIQNIRLGGVPTAIQANDSTGVTLQGIHVEGAGIGVQISQSSGMTIRNSSFRNGTIGISALASSGVNLNHLVIWSNLQAGVRLSLSGVNIQNSVFGIFDGAECFGIDLDANSSWTSEYNFFDRTGNSLIARRLLSGTLLDLRWQSVTTWSRETSNDVRSLSGDPEFSDRNAGDFHPRSTAGRYNRATGLFTNDVVTSPLIDAGAPLSDFSIETGPNGNRVNIGMYGNHFEASRSPTNSRLTVARLNDGGRAEGSLVPLTWVAAGAATSQTVRLEASFDNGITWSLIQSNVPANAEILFWDSTTNAAWFGRWRLISEQSPVLIATNSESFTIRNAGLSLYVNDNSTAGDLYTTALGDTVNSGAEAGKPRSDLQYLLDTYDLEPGDTIYVDTGEYTLGSPISIGRYDAWNDMANLSSLQAGGTSLRILGSTNVAANGSRFIRSGSGNAMELRTALGVYISNLSIQHVQIGSGISIDLLDSPYALVEWCRLIGGSKGVSVFRSVNTRMHRVLARNNVQQGIYVRDSTGVELLQSVLYSNVVGLAVEFKGSITARNNAIVALAPNSVGWQRNDGPNLEQIGELISNYNLMWSATDAFIAELVGNQYPAGRRRFQRMANWNEATGLDLRSMMTNPQFKDPLNGDFHPQSPFGRYAAGSGYVTNINDILSPLIDTGDPLLAFVKETNPNGQRVNMGLYGNSDQSSLSPSNGSLQVLTFRDGGSSSGEITLRWAVGGLAASHQVTLEFSNDGGASWTNIASNIPASDQTYVWDSEPYGRAAAGLWRVVSQNDPTVTSQTEQFFALRQGGTIPYYVNDLETTDDVYCTAPGNNANSGFLPSAPKASLQDLLDNIDLEPGDVVYMDTGSYSVNLSTLWGELDGGTATNPVILRGSTNKVGGITTMDRITKLGSALFISSVDGVSVRNVRFINGSHGVSVESSQNISLHEITAEANNLAGVRVAGSSPVLMENSLIWNNPTNGISVGQFSAQQLAQLGLIIMRNNTIWGSSIGLRIDDGGSVDARNNLFRVNGADSRVYFLAIGVTNIVSDYNAYYRQNGALMAERAVEFGGNEFIARLLDWQRDLGNDLRSLSHDPLVADAGSGDFHLISASGRVLPSGVITNDADGLYSPLIDTGDPASVWTNEPATHGSRVNIGRYGNTPEASRSRTNGWLIALTLNDGGRISGTNTIRWAAGNWATSSTVRVEYANDGVDYTVLATNVPVYQGQIIWNASDEDITQLARWRVTSEQSLDISSTVQSPFVIKNQNLFVYVNDASTSGDVYTFSEGNSTNSGVLPTQPLDDPSVALEKFPFSEGDILYIDTGNYFPTNAFGMRIGLIGDTLKAGLPGDPIRIIGSTNKVDGGATIYPTGPNQLYGMLVTRTKFVSLEHLDFSGFTNGVVSEASEGVSCLNLNAYDNGVGYKVNNVIDARFDYCSASRNRFYGLTGEGTFSSVTWNHGVMWSNQVAAIRHLQGPLNVNNSILVSATNSLIYEINSAFAINKGDNNIYFPVQSDALMRDELGGVMYRNVRSWQRARNMDTNSFVVDPLFYDPGAGDFHVLSQEGRYLPLIGTSITDEATSWAIDAGALGDAFNLEPSPNGGRLNIGVHGNTTQASLSTTNRGLFVVSLRDGGTAASPQPLIWLTSGLTTSDTVRIEYTPNNGIDWFVLSTNVAALNRTYLWENGLLESTPLARWRITLETDSSISDTSAISKIRNGSILYYVNDNSTSGDIYSAAVGSSFNNGITVSTPVHSVQAIIDQYELEGGDVVYVDTGYYQITSNIIMRADDSGIGTNRVVIMGSTNRLAGGSRLNRVIDQPWTADDSNTNAVFELIRAANVEIAHLILENANIGIYVNNSLPQADNLYLHHLDIRDGGHYGMKIAGSFDNIIERVLIYRLEGKGIAVKSGSASVGSSVLWSNKTGAIEWSGGTLNLSNSIMSAFGPITNAVLSISKSTVISDYNNFYPQGDASYVLLDGEPITGLPQWTVLVTQDLHSISVEPGFASPTNNNYYPRSAAGRFDPISETYVTNDVDYSWLIDTGNPATSYTNEPSPNGGRRNIGPYGDTTEASKSRSEPWLLAVTAMAGGRIGDFFPLHWFYGNLEPTNRVHLEFSIDSGTNWYSIVSNIQINVDGYLWNSRSATPFFQSPTTKWRVKLVANTNLVDETDRIFGLNGPFRFFINDNQTTGDVFTTAIGNDMNLGISSNAPKATLRAILDSWDIDPLDSIYIDTGNYVFQSNDLAVVRINNRGAIGNPVSIIGSTNGAVLDGSALLSGDTVRTLVEINAPYIEVDHINLRLGGIDALGTNVILRDMYIEGGVIKLAGGLGVLESFFLSNGTVFVSGPDSIVRSGYLRDGSLELEGDRATLINTVVAGNVSPLVKISGTNVVVINNTLVANRTAIEQSGADSRSELRNNILLADGALGIAFAIDRKGGVIDSNYNLFKMRNGAWFGNAQNGLWERLIYWQQNSGNDINSIVDDPFFANEAMGEYHLKSVSGRSLNGIWVTDAVHSAAIDVGAPFDSFIGETAPNGSRINIGAYGNTEQASRSRTSPWLYAITMNDGGVIRDTDSLRWYAGGMTSTNRVTLQYSANGGTNWTTIVSNIPALNGSYLWNTTTASNTLDGLWRVILEANPSVQDQSDSIFNIRNDVRAFYVNNATTNGDVYTSVPGSSLNDGRSPATPKATLEDLFAVYDTEAFDTVYVDTGIYTSSVIQVIWSRGGNSNGYMTMRGSTNLAAGGSVIKRPAMVDDAMTLNASYVKIQHLTFENAGRGLFISTNRNVLLEQIEARSNVMGIVISGGNAQQIKSSRVWANINAGVEVSDTSGINIENITFANNSPASILFRSNVVNSVIQNNIFYHDIATSNQQFAMFGPTGVVLTAFIDYNVYYFGPNASSNSFIYGTYKDLLTWQRQQYKDFRSAITNPLLNSVNAGSFYPRSEAGRFSPGLNGFVMDSETSWVIDKGNPGSAFDQEPSENGGRINIGAFGNTPYASKGSTNGIVFIRTANNYLSLTEADNPYPLLWYVLNVPDDITVMIQYSGDGGNEWINLQTGVPIYQEVIVWTNSPIYNSFDARWRIVGEGVGFTNYWDINDGQIKTFFGVHRISKIQVNAQKQNQFIWRGAWNEDYQLQYATNFINPIYYRTNVVSLVGSNLVTNIVKTITNGGTIVWSDLGAVTNLIIGGDTLHTDVLSTNDPYRLYRVIWLGTNGVPYQ